MDLSEHQVIIDRLKFEHRNPRLRELLEEELGNRTSGHLVFTLRTEINRLNKPSTRPFRIEQTLPHIEWFPHVHDGVTHHFDDVTFAEFRHQINQYQQRYTVGVEEHMQNFLKKNKEKILHAQLISTLDITPMDVSESIYRKEERMHLGVRGLAYPLHRKPAEHTELSSLVVSGREIHVITQNVSENGLSVKAATPGRQGDWWLIRFSGLEQNFVFSQPYILYQCVGSEPIVINGTEKGEHRLAMKKAEHIQHQEFNNFLKKLIFANRGRYKVDLANVERSVYHNITEQFITNRQEGFSIYATSTGEFPFAFGNVYGKECFALFQHEHLSTLPALAIKDQLIGNSQERSVFWVVIRQRGGAFFSTCLTHKHLDKLFFQHALSRDDSIFFQVSSSPVNPEGDAYRSHCLPHLGEMSKKIDRLRRLTDHYADCTREAIDQITHVIHFKPVEKCTIALFIDEISNITATQQQSLSQFALKQTKKHNVRYITARSRDLRKEDRFTLCTPVLVQSELGTIQATSIDISESGCCLSLQSAHPSLQNRAVTLSFPQLPSIDGLSATGRYKVLSDHHGTVRLFSDPERRLAAQSYMAAYLDKHFNQLEPVHEMDRDGHFMLGLERALRNLHNATLPHMRGLILRHQNIMYPAKINVSPRNVDPLFLARPSLNTPSGLLKSVFCNVEVQRQLAQDFRAIDAKTPYCRHILLVALDDQSGDAPFVRIAPIQEWSSTRLHMLMGMLKKKGWRPLAYQLDVTRKTRVFDRYYREELSYIERVASHRAERIHEFIKGAAGVLALTPLQALVEGVSSRTLP